LSVISLCVFRCAASPVPSNKPKVSFSVITPRKFLMDVKMECICGRLLSRIINCEL
jgi:hypothetical protein